MAHVRIAVTRDPAFLDCSKIAAKTSCRLNLPRPCIWRACVTPQDVIPTQDVIIAARCNTIYARCNKYAKCNDFYARCNNTYQREM